MIDAYTAFIAAYYILDAALDEMKSEVVSQWASEANPFLFKDIGSADPAIYIEFKNAWDKKFGEDAIVGNDECKTFIKDYLAGLSPDCLKAFDITYDSGTWDEEMKEIQEQANARRNRLKK